jgi:hypothetical protein
MLPAALEQRTQHAQRAVDIADGVGNGHNPVPWLFRLQMMALFRPNRSVSVHQ